MPGESVWPDRTNGGSTANLSYGAEVERRGHLEALLSEAINKRYVNTHRATPTWIEAALAAARGRIAGPRGAAAKLGIPRQTLDSRITALGIDKNTVLPNL